MYSSEFFFSRQNFPLTQSINSGITMSVCSPWECSSFLVQLCSLASGGFVLRMIQIGRIEVDFVDPSGFKHF